MESETLAERKQRARDLREALHEGYSELLNLEHEIMLEEAAERGVQVEQTLITTERYVATINGKTLSQLNRK